MDSCLDLARAGAVRDAEPLPGLVVPRLFNHGHHRRGAIAGVTRPCPPREPAFGSDAGVDVVWELRR